MVIEAGAVTIEDAMTDGTTDAATTAGSTGVDRLRDETTTDATTAETTADDRTTGTTGEARTDDTEAGHPMTVEDEAGAVTCASTGKKGGATATGASSNTKTGAGTGRGIEAVEEIRIETEDETTEEIATGRTRENDGEGYRSIAAEMINIHILYLLMLLKL